MTMTPDIPAVAPFAIHEREFEAVLGDEPQLVKVAEVDAHEGPVYLRSEHALYFTSLPPDAMVKRLDLEKGEVSIVRGADANAPNGMTLDRGGRLVICEQGSMSSPARI